MNKTEVKKIINNMVKDHWNKNSDYLFIITTDDEIGTACHWATNMNFRGIYKSVLALLVDKLSSMDTLSEDILDAFKNDLKTTHAHLVEEKNKT